MAQYKDTTNNKFHETTMLVNDSGDVIDSSNPLSVTLGSENVTITGNVNVGSTVEITNDDGSPIPTHTHLFDDSDNEYTDANPLPVGGTIVIEDGGNSITVDGSVNISDGGNSITVDGSVDIGSMPEVEIKNDTGNPLSVIGTTTNPWGNAVLAVDDDTVQHTSKNRRKVSTYEITDFATFPFSKNENDFDEAISGTASGTHMPYLGMVQLSVGSSPGDQIIRQSKRVQRYLPGRQNEFSGALILNNLADGIRARVGIFDELNGAFFEYVDGDYNCVIRRNTAGGVVEARIPRSSWSDDKLDGTGPSGIIADPSMIQLVVIEYEWYGAGQVEWKFVIDNNAHAVHKVNNANANNHTWASKASLPVRYELTNVDGVTGTHTMLQGSHAFLTEGTTTLLGKQLSVSNTVTGKTLASKNTFYPLVAVRLKSSALSSVVIPDEYSAGCLDKTDLFVRVIQDPTVTGGTWVSAGTDSPLEYNITATSFTGGNVESTKFISEKLMGDSISFAERSISQIGRKTTTTLADTSEIYLIAAAATDDDKDAWASLGWIEVR